MSYRIAVIGPSCSGKSSLVHTYTHGQPPVVPPSVTLGVDILTGTHDDGTKTYIWDTAGGPSRNHVLQHYLPGSHAIVLVYDATKTQEDQLNDVRSCMSLVAGMTNNMRSVPMLVVGNKIDMIGKRPLKLPDKLCRYLQTRQIEHRYLTCNDAEAVQDAFEHVRLSVHRSIPSPLTTSAPLPDPGEDDVLCQGCQII